MKDQKNFLFSISGVTCSKHLADQGSNLIVLIHVKCFLPLNNEEFLVLLTIVFFTNSITTYHIKSYLGGFVELYFHYF